MTDSTQQLPDMLVELSESKRSNMATRHHLTDKLPSRDYPSVVVEHFADETKCLCTVEAIDD